MTDLRPRCVRVRELPAAAQAELARRRADKDQWTEYGVAWWWPVFALLAGVGGVALVAEILGKYGRGTESAALTVAVLLGVAVTVSLAVVGLRHFVRSCGRFGRTLTSFGYAEVHGDQLWLFSWAALAELHRMPWEQMRRVEPRAMRTFWFEAEIRERLAAGGDFTELRLTGAEFNARRDPSFLRVWATLSVAMAIAAGALFALVDLRKQADDVAQLAAETAWLTQLSDPLPHVRRQAAEAAAERCTAAQLPTLLAGLADPRDDVRAAVARALVSVLARVPATDDARRRLVAVAREDGSAAVRAQAVRALSLSAGGPGAVEVTDVLRRATQAAARSERRAGIRGVASARAHMPDAAAVLLAAVGPQDTREDVVAALSRLGERARPAIVAAAKGSGPAADVAKAALCAQRARDFRRAWFAAKTASQRVARVQALDLCGEASLAALWSAVGEGDDAKGAVARAGLERIASAGKAGLPFLVKAAHYKTHRARGSSLNAYKRSAFEARVRETAVSLIGDGGHTSAARTLVMALRDRSTSVRIAAARALGKLGPAAAAVSRDPLNRAAQDQLALVAKAAKAALAAVDAADAVTATGAGAAR